MAKRTSQIVTSVEYKPPHMARTSQVVASVEYKPPHKARTSQLVVMVEYWVDLNPPTPATGRKYGPALGNG